MQTCRGSHTHTLVTSPNDTANVYVYGSGTGRCARPRSWPAAPAGDPKEDPNTALFSIDVIKVPLAAPEQGARSSTGRASSPTRRPATMSGLWQGGNHGAGHADARA